METNRTRAQKRHRLIYIITFIVTPLFLAFSIYLFCRPTNTVIFKIFESIAPEPITNWIDTQRLALSGALPYWLVYSLPGGFWLFSFQNTIRLMYNFRRTRLLFIGLFVSGLSSIGLEILQLLRITDGVFDGLDLIFYLLATLLSFSLSYNYKLKDIEIKSKLKFSPVVVLSAFSAIVYLADVF